ncbi:MAG TPA: DUF2867 domain-containing protein [Micromonosporaceae bacterium]|nr:DUF2867 domain-containing protein [Micromonosporaceae bacterium]
MRDVAAWAARLTRAVVAALRGRDLALHAAAVTFYGGIALVPVGLLTIRLAALLGGADRLAGGAGLRRGRRDPHRLQTGDALDFWRVEEIIPGELLRLRAEMRLPGRGLAGDVAQPVNAGRSRYRQRAVFLPRGLAGHAYWAAVWPFHAVVFGGMARNIARTAEREPERAQPA